MREYLVECDYLTADRVSVSSSSVTFGTGGKSLTVETGKAFQLDAGQPVYVIPAATGDVDHAYMRGRITAYNSGTGALSVTVTSKVDPLSGTNTQSSWIVRQPRKLRASMAGYTSPPKCPSGASNDEYAAYNNLHWPATLAGCTIQRSAFQPGLTRCIGQPYIGRATVTLRNEDGRYDDLVDASFDGLGMRIMYGQTDTPYEAFDSLGGFYMTSIPTADQHDAGVLLGGVSEQGVFDDNAGTFTIAARDMMHLLDRPLQPRKYGGTNTAGAGVDGEGDIKGRPVPIALGPVFNVTPVLVNSTLYIYQVHYKALSHATSTLVVKDGLVALTQGATYTNQADMEANAPSAGQCRILNSSGGVYVRLGSVPTHKLTIDVNNATWYTGGVGNNRWIYAVNDVMQQAVYASGLADAVGMTGVAPTCGLYVDTDANLLDVIGGLALSAIGGVYANKYGTAFVGRTLEYNSGEYELAETDVLSLSRRIPSDPERGIPPFYYQTKYGRNYTVMSDAEIAGAVSVDDRKFAKQEDRRYTSGGDAASKKQWLAAPEMTLPTYIHAGVTAPEDGGVNVIHVDLDDHYRELRHLLEVQVMFTRETAKFELLNQITLTHSRYGLDAGRPMKLLGYELNAVTEELTLTLWG